MPRIDYRDENNKPLPGVTTVISILDKPALKFWAFKQGQLYERGEIGGLYEARDKAADAGTLAHLMLEHHLKGLPEPSRDGVELSVWDRASGCFLAYLEWERSHKFEPLGSEISLVSAKHGFGGTIDMGAVMGDRAIIDLKTSKDVYLSMKIQVAAYKELYNENYPVQPLTACHILRLGPDGSFSHHYYADLSAEWEIFLHCLAIYKSLKATGQRL